MKKLIAVVFSLLFALLLCYLVGRYRLWLIRLLLHSPLPRWLKALLWGWV